MEVENEAMLATPEEVAAAAAAAADNGNGDNSRGSDGFSVIERYHRSRRSSTELLHHALLSEHDWHIHLAERWAEVRHAIAAVESTQPFSLDAFHHLFGGFEALGELYREERDRMTWKTVVSSFKSQYAPKPGNVAAYATFCKAWERFWSILNAPDQFCRETHKAKSPRATISIQVAWNSLGVEENFNVWTMHAVTKYLFSLLARHEQRVMEFVGMMLCMRHEQRARRTVEIKLLCELFTFKTQFRSAYMFFRALSNSSFQRGFVDKIYYAFCIILSHGIRPDVGQRNVSASCTMLYLSGLSGALETIPKYRPDASSLLNMYLAVS